MKKPQNTSRATLRHAPATTGRDGAIDFAAKVEASSAERVIRRNAAGRIEVHRRLDQDATGAATVEAGCDPAAGRTSARRYATAAKTQQGGGEGAGWLVRSSIASAMRRSPRTTGKAKAPAHKGPGEFGICATTSPSRRADDSPASH